MNAARPRGMNLGGWFSQIDCVEEKDPKDFPGIETHMKTFIQKEDLRAIAGWGFDHVRLPIDGYQFFGKSSGEPCESRLRLLDAAIADAHAAGLKVILDLHKCPGHDFHEGSKEEQSFFHDPALLEQTKTIWKTLARRYASSYPEMTLEILNEPTAADSADWNRVKDALWEMLRDIAPRNPILIGSNRWNSAREFSRLTPVPDKNVIYSFHFYAPLVFTHQRAPWIPGEAFRHEYPYPGEYGDPSKHVRLDTDSGYWDRRRLDAELEEVRRFRDRHDASIACNEFGVYVGGPDRASQLRWTSDFLGILRYEGFGFTYWNYKNLDFGIVPKGESMYEDYPQYQNGARRDEGLLDLLRKS
jgi:endoglucanase